MLLQVAEVFTGTPGKYVPLENTIKDFKGVLEVRQLVPFPYSSITASDSCHATPALGLFKSLLSSATTT
jgi:hypothetical protein